MSNLNFTTQGYKIQKELGRNTTGGCTTYLATDLNHKTPVVIKQFEFARPGASWAEYEIHQQEIQLLKQLYHPQIPCYLDDFETPTGLCLIQEYKPAPSLLQPRHFTPQETKEIALGVLEILVYLQEQIPPIFHRDIRPENILVDRSGLLKVYLVGFGLARQGETGVNGAAKDSLGFIPPEQILNHPLTTASDLYSLGATLICLLTDTPPQEVGKLIDETFNFNLKPLEGRISPEFIRWLRKMVAPRLKDRYPNAAVALAALKPIPVFARPSLAAAILQAIPQSLIPPVAGIVGLSFAAALSSNLLLPDADRPNPEPKSVTIETIEFPQDANPAQQLLVTRECLDCNLEGIQLREANLAGAVLSLANLKMANLQGAKLQGADLKLANLARSQLQGINLQGAYVEKANLSRANLNGANLQGANFSLASFQEANLQGANLYGAILRQAQLEGVNLRGAILQDTNFHSAYLGYALMDGVDLQGANLDYANLEAAYLNHADLQAVNLEYAYLNNASLQYANLEGANLTGANLEGADLRRANLQNANLTGANLGGADLRGAQLKGARMPNGMRWKYQRIRNSKFGIRH